MECLSNLELEIAEKRILIEVMPPGIIVNETALRNFSSCGLSKIDSMVRFVFFRSQNFYRFFAAKKKTLVS